MFPESQFFRASVGALITDGRWNVLALERSDVPSAWQLPQGGIEAEEEPLDAVRREITEETGILWRDLRMIGEYPELLAYELPLHFRSKKTGRGQVQKWFLFRCHDSGILPIRPGPEFANWQWMPIEQLVASVVSFRRPIYQKLRIFLESHRKSLNDNYGSDSN